MPNVPCTPPGTYWLQIRDEHASAHDVLVAGPWPSEPATAAPILVARGIGAHAHRLSAMYLASGEGTPEPLAEAHGLLFLAPADVFAVLSRRTTLRQYLCAGGHAILRSRLQEDLPLEAHLQLRMLPTLLGRHLDLVT